VPMRHFVICGPSSCTIHYLISDTVFEKKKINIKLFLLFSLHFLSDTVLVLRKAERDRIIYSNVLDGYNE
jgi:hypothetical protein